MYLLDMIPGQYIRIIIISFSGNDLLPGSSITYIGVKKEGCVQVSSLRISNLTLDP